MSRAKKVLTEEQKKRAQDKTLQHKFGITLADRDELVRQQDNKCKICGGPLDAYGPPNIDHFHFYTRAERNTSPALVAINLKWHACTYNEKREVVFTRHASTKAAAMESVKRATMPWSIRSLLCFKCNRGLGYIERFFNAAQYPENLLPVIDYLRARLKP